MDCLQQCFPAMVLQNTVGDSARKCGQESNTGAKKKEAQLSQKANLILALDVNLILMFK